MIVANLYHIKNTNGLFYYGIDYLRENSELIRKVLIRSELINSARQALPKSTLEVCTAKQMVREVMKASLRGDIVYTPTPHPLPGISRQWIVVHDTYPFTTNYMGRIKRQLLRWSLATSRCLVAYINESDTQPFIASLGVRTERQLFAPNKFPLGLPQSPQTVRTIDDRLWVGLVGTDSSKKNYEILFAEIIKAGASKLFGFRVYGHQSAYLDGVISQYPNVDLELVESDCHSLAEFFSSVHLLVSVAVQEGFGRPIAAALMAGVPCFLISRPVFREFFDPGACFFNDEPHLVRALISHANRALLQSPNYKPPAKVLQAYSIAVSRLGDLGSPNITTAN